MISPRKILQRLRHRKPARTSQTAKRHRVRVLMSESLEDRRLLAGVTDSVGSNQTHNNLQPSLAMDYYIALQGIFPSPGGGGGDSGFLGEIRPYAAAFGGEGPFGWAKAQGQLLPISQNTALFSILGTMYGGDGETTFALPDLRGRTALSDGSGPGAPPTSVGQSFGTETASATLPSHLHAIGNATLNSTGAGGGHNNIQPSLGIRYLIRTQGLFENLGEVTMFAGNFAPGGYLEAAGQLLPISQNPALFSRLGTTYGGDGETSFALPDLRGRALVGAGNGFLLGEKTGTEQQVLTQNQMPAHTHSVSGKTTSSAGGSQPHNEVQPSTTMRYAIALTGLYNSIGDFEPAIGEIRAFPNSVPQGWIEANGQLLSIAQNTALFSLLGTTYGGDGEVTFGLPNLQGRTLIGAGQGPGLANYNIGQEAGAATVTLTVGQMPSHTHAFQSDLGDAPDSYMTLRASGGPEHLITSSLMIGAAVDDDSNGFGDGTEDYVDTATDDDQTNVSDEDGVMVFSALTADATDYSIDVSVHNATGGDATLIGWIDFDGNGSFESSESTTVTVADGTTSATLNWTGLSGLAAGATFARLRLTTDTIDGTNVGGFMTDGEVEDHALTIAPGSTTGVTHAEIGFDFGTDSSPIASGYVGGASAAYDAEVGYGWQGEPVSVFDRAAQSDALLRDGHWGQNETFLVDLANGDYSVSVTTGDQGRARDRLDVIVEGTDALTGVATAAGEYWHGSFVTSVTDGQLDLQLVDRGGDRYFTINALEIRPASDVLTHSITNTGNSFTASGATPNSKITVKSSTGVVTTTDVDPNYAGVQVMADATGAFSFEVLADPGATAPEVTSEEVTGAGKGMGTGEAASLGDVRRYDFDNSDVDTQAGFVSVRAGDLYDAADGFGYVSSPNEFARNGITSMVSDSLYNDGHWQSATRVFQVEAESATTYDVRVYTGDKGRLRDRLQVTVEGAAAPVESTPTSANVFTTVTVFGGSDQNGDGKLDITFTDLGGDRYYSVNGVDVAASSAGLPASAPLLVDGSFTATSGTAATAAALTTADLQPLVDHAVQQWTATGLDASQVGRLQQVQFQIQDLNDQGAYGLAGSRTVLIDDNGGGSGWFVDTTPATSDEFASGAVSTQVDLLTVVMHELGHILGYGDLDPAYSSNDLMTGRFGAGQRRMLAFDDGASFGQTLGSPLASNDGVETDLALGSLLHEPVASINGDADQDGDKMSVAEWLASDDESLAIDQQRAERERRDWELAFAAMDEGDDVDGEAF